MIPFKKLPIGESDFKAVEEVLASKSLSMGRTVAKLEEEFAKYVGAKYAVAVNSCTSALFLSLMHDKGDNKVGIPSMTVPLVANTIIHTGKELVFLDEVDWVGGAYWLSWTNIWDSAHEVKKLSKIEFDGILRCYSFYPTKPVCSAEGGMVCTNDFDAFEWLKKARWYGRNSGESSIKNSWEYTIEFPGWKMNMTDLQASIALSQLRKMPDLTKERDRVLKRYNETLGLKNKSHYLYRIHVRDRTYFLDYMKANGVECGVHFAPLHKMEAYQPYVHGEFPKTEEEYKHTASLPFYDSLEDWEIDKICRLIKDWGN